MTDKEDYPVKIMDSYYKVGLHGLVYWLNGGEWVRSTKPIEQLEAAVEARDSKRKKCMGEKI
jgi:hypothetical protein